METSSQYGRGETVRSWVPSWYRGLDTGARRALFASLGGWAIDAFDFMVFSFVITALIEVWGIDRAQAGLLSTVTLVFSAVGGWAAGLLADRYGRARVLQWTIVWFSACTVAIGFAQNFEQVFVLRALQGIGFGGEWAVGAVLVGEMVNTQDRGKAVGFVQSGWAVGWAFAAVAYNIAFSLLPESIAWRSLFWISVLPAALVLYLRRYVREPEAFERNREDASVTARGSIMAIFSPSLLWTTVLSSILCTGIQAGYYAMSTWLPTYLKIERHLTVLNTSGYLLVIIAGSFAGYIIGAYLADYWGRRRNFMVFSVLALLIVLVYLRAPLSNTWMLFLGFPLGFASCAISSGIGAYLTELFPSVHRASGQSFAYNFGRGIGALSPVLVGHISQSVGLAAAIAIFAGSAYSVIFLVTLVLPETKGKVLSDMSPN